ncbi:MAG: MCE family protein [Lentisphaeria bacterium]|nr:MCE family protein [Lentisphaeria bacterium]
MNEREQNLRIGIFAVTGLLLILAMLFFFGLSDIFVKKVQLFTYFSESVQGLNVGSQVKYRGVPVGSVSQLSIEMDSKKVFVIMDIEPRYFRNITRSGDQETAFFKMFEGEIQNGLRCRLEFAGITGMKFIDLDYFASTGKHASAAAVRQTYAKLPGAHYIPSVQSSIKDLSGTLSSALERFSSIRFEDIAHELERSLGRMSEILSDPAIRSAINRINDAAEHLEVSTSTVTRVLDEKRLTRLLDTLEKDLEVIKQLGEQLSGITTEMKLPESTAAFRKALDDLLESREDITSTLSKFNQTLESIRMLTDYLGTDPSSVIKGKQAPGQKK